MKSPLVFLLLATGACATGTSLAGDRPDADWRDGRDNYDRGNYRNDYRGEEDYAQVVDVDPIYRSVMVSEPRQECRQELRYDSRNADRPAGGHMVLGGLIGAVIGHQFGYGRERAGATLAGAVIGSAIGHDAGQRTYDYDRRNHDDRETVQRCRTRYDEHEERRVSAYEVTYRYNGRLYTTQLPYDPGDRLPVSISVEPRPQAR